MNAELLLLAKMYSELISVSHKTYENTIAIYSHLIGISEENAQIFLEQMVLERESTGLHILRVLLENLQREFPACFEQGVPIDELIRKISPSFPGKNPSPYKGDLN